MDENYTQVQRMFIGPSPDLVFYVCKKCGSMVWNCEQHDLFHDGISYNHTAETSVR